MKRRVSDNQPGDRLARKKYTFRLPIPLAARIEALCDLHPRTPRRQLIADLLTLGVAEVENVHVRQTDGVPSWWPKEESHIYLLTGPFSEFHGLARKHHLAMEHALDNDKAPPSLLDYQLDDVD